MPDRKYNDQRTLSTYVDAMIMERGDAKELSMEMRGALKRALLEGLNDAIEKAILAALPDSKLLELEKILDNDGSDEELDKFFAGVEDVDATPAIKQAMEKFRADYLAGGVPDNFETEIERTQIMQIEAENEDDLEGVVQSPGDEPLTEEEYERLIAANGEEA